MCSKYPHADRKFTTHNIPPFMYGSHPDVQCISLHMLTFLKTPFISKQTINICCR